MWFTYNPRVLRRVLEPKIPFVFHRLPLASYYPNTYSAPFPPLIPQNHLSAVVIVYQVSHTGVEAALNLFPGPVTLVLSPCIRQGGIPTVAIERRDLEHNVLMLVRFGSVAAHFVLVLSIILVLWFSIVSNLLLVPWCDFWFRWIFLPFGFWHRVSCLNSFQFTRQWWLGFSTGELSTRAMYPLRIKREMIFFIIWERRRLVTSRSRCCRVSPR